MTQPAETRFFIDNDSPLFLLDLVPIGLIDYSVWYSKLAKANFVGITPPLEQLQLVYSLIDRDKVARPIRTGLIAGSFDINRDTVQLRGQLRTNLIPGDLTPASIIQLVRR